MDCLIRIEDRVVRLSKHEHNLLIDVCNDLIKLIKRRMNLFNEDEMIENILLMEYIEEINDLIDKIEG